MVYYKGRNYAGAGGRGPCPAGFTKGHYGCKPIRKVRRSRTRELDRSSRPRVSRPRHIEARETVSSRSFVENIITAAVSAATLGATYYFTQKYPGEVQKRFKPSKVSSKTMVGVRKYAPPPRYRFKHRVPSRRTFGGFKGGAIRSAAYRAIAGKRY